MFCRSFVKDNFLPYKNDAVELPSLGCSRLQWMMCHMRSGVEQLIHKIQEVVHSDEWKHTADDTESSIQIRRPARSPQNEGLGRHVMHFPQITANLASTVNWLAAAATSA